MWSTQVLNGNLSLCSRNADNVFQSNKDSEKIQLSLNSVMGVGRKRRAVGTVGNPASEGEGLSPYTQQPLIWPKKWHQLSESWKLHGYWKF
jgi:hypothetical protein